MSEQQNNHKQKPEAEPKQRSQHLVRSVVTIERPDARALTHCNRAEKYRRLREHNGQMRTQLLNWIDAHGLSEEVLQVSEPTAFNTLFVVATRHALDELSHAPGVVQVAEDGDITTDLPRPETAE